MTSVTRTDNRDDPPNLLHDLPGWARIVAVLGFPGVIALYLVWLIGSGLPGRIEAHAIESRDAVSKQLTLLQQICANTASTPEEKGACWRMRP